MSDGFFVTDLPLDVEPGSFVEVRGAEAHHAAVVRRVRIGESLTLTDGNGRGVTAVAVEVTRETLAAEVTGVLLAARSRPRITVVQALPKNDRVGLAVDLMTEVGVDVILPWQAARSLGKWNREKWVSAAREASKQARRLSFPVIGELVSTAQVKEIIADKRCLVMHEKEAVPLAAASLTGVEEVVIVIGPEGGLTDDEVEGFQQAGAQTYSLGPTVLRTSTAGAVAVAKVQATWVMSQPRDDR